MTQTDFSIATWNINSVRLRRGLVEKFILDHAPDVICLQETKCQNAEFPSAAFTKLGYHHLAVHGQKAYHGVATLSRLPLEAIERRDFCQMGDARHVKADVLIGDKKISVHNFYVPAGGDEPDTAKNPKFDHKLRFLDEMEQVTAKGGENQFSLLLGDLNIAPLPEDVWLHKQLLKVVSHTPVETEGLERVRQSAGWADLVRDHFGSEEVLFSWWSYRAKDWAASNRGRRLDHIWGSSNIQPKLNKVEIISAARGWEKPSDHVPVVARFKL
ncbi:MAG: exodeoxyribonuclease III [Pseudomonadota bacterium]